MISSQEAIDRFGDAYRAMVDAGIFASTFSGSYDIPRQPWEMHFSMLRPMEDDTAKTVVSLFLEAEYDARDIKFFRQGASKTQFYATFQRGDC